MNAKPRNHSQLAKSNSERMSHLSAFLLTMAVSLFASETVWGQHHHAAAAAQRVVGCIDGQCGIPVSPFGHYQGSWRRWPYSKDTPVERRPIGKSPLDSIVPDAVEESRIRPRTRSDRPLDPKDMGLDAGSDMQPFVPNPADQNNPFNNTVEESDLPNSPIGPGDATDNASDSLFSPTVPETDAEDSGGSLFDIPTNPPSTDSGAGDLFDQSHFFPPPPSQRTPKLGTRSIISRGVSLQARGKLTNQVVQVVSSAGAKLPEQSKSEQPVIDDTLGLASYSESVPDTRALETPTKLSPSAARLTASQIEDVQKLPTKDDLAPSRNTMMPAATEPVRRNPLRRSASGPATAATTVTEPTPSQQTEGISAELLATKPVRT